MKKVLYVAHENTKGGATHSLLNLLDHLPMNVQPYVLIPKTLGLRTLFTKDYRKILNAGTLKQELIKRNIPFYEAYYFLDNIEIKQNLIRKLFFSLIRNKELMKIKKKIKDNKINLVHSNSSVIKFGADLAKGLNLKHIWHVREDIGAMFGIKGIKQKKYILNIVDNADQIIFVANSLKANFQEVYQKLFGELSKEQKNKFRRIYNGIPLTTSINKKNIKQNPINIYCFGTVYEIKGQEDLILLAKKLKQEGFPNFRIKLVGGRKKEYYDYLLNLIALNNLEEIIEFIDYTNDIDLLRSDADIEIVSSRNEAFGRVAIEAMNFGNPLIVTNVGGLNEIVEHKKNGLKYKPGDINALYENVKDIIDSKLNMDEMILNAKIRSSEFDIKICVSQISKLY